MPQIVVKVLVIISQSHCWFKWHIVSFFVEGSYFSFTEFIFFSCMRNRWIIVLQVLPELIKTNNAICKMAKSFVFFFKILILYACCQIQSCFKASTRYGFSSLKSRMIKIFVLQSAPRKLDSLSGRTGHIQQDLHSSRYIGFLHGS